MKIIVCNKKYSLSCALEFFRVVAKPEPSLDAIPAGEAFDDEYA